MEEQHYSGARSETSKKNKDKKSSARGWLLCIVIAVAAALFIRYFVAEPVQVSGDSMNPSLYSHQTMLVEKVSKLFSLPNRGDVVIVHYPGSNDNFVKRVIGLPGDTVAVSNSTVYINGVALEEDYTSNEPYFDMNEIIVPEESIFVMGDNRANSHDSRSVGAIPKEQIVGHSVAVIWPIDQMHIIE